MLLAIPESLVMLSGTDTDLWHEPLSQLLQSCMEFLDGNTSYAIDELDGSQISKVHDVLVECFQLLCKISRSDDTSRLSVLAPKIVALRLTASTRDSFMASFRLYVEKLQQSQYVELLSGLLDALYDESRTTSASVLPLLALCATRPSQNDAESGVAQHLRLLSKLLAKITDTQDVLAQKKAIGCVATALKGNSSLMSQYGIELTLQTLEKVLDTSSMAQVVYLDVCQVLSTILLQYRSRLHGRLHLVVQVFQALLTRLFRPANPGKATGNQGRKPTVKHAQAFSKLLTLLCEPPQFIRSSKSSSLVDESRKEQAHVGKSVHYILHHYCSQILTGKLEPGMREAITPGLWSMIEAMEMSEAEGIKSLSAAMNNSERAVLRGVYDDWRRFGKWRGA
jgi:nucleolar pre-ribosomal-associated protein 2